MKRPAMRSRTDEMLDEWDRLRRAGVLRVEAARRIGVQLKTLEQALRRHRDDPRAKPGQRRELYIKVRDEATGRYVA